jgi:hypothetical protein
MASLRKIFKTSIFIAEDDPDFLRMLKQLFARGIENYKLSTFTSVDDMYKYVLRRSSGMGRTVLILPISAHLVETNNVFDTIEAFRKELRNVHVVLLNNPGEFEQKELERYHVEYLVDDIITKNNFARLRIQNAIRRIVSRDDFVIRRKLLYASGATATFFFLTTLLLLFV